MQKRIAQVQKLLEKDNLDALLVSSVPNITYLTGFSNFSIEEREAFLLITKTDAYIFTDARYSEAVVHSVPFCILKEISSQTPFTKLIKQLVIEQHLMNFGFEPGNLTVSEYETISKNISKQHLEQTTGGIENIRIIKTDEEVSAIKKACAIGDTAYDAVLPKITEGITENALALELEISIKQQGASLSFSPIVAFGANSSVPHHQTGSTKLQNNQWILLDFGVKYNNYCSDMTRTLFFGKPTDKQKRMYKTVKTAQARAIASLTSQQSLTGAEVDRVARDYILSQGYPSIPHGLGHGIGVEVHEQPGLHPYGKQLLQEGMVFSIEPGIYQPGSGGVRIEDIALLTQNGIEILTHSPSSFLVL